MTRIRSERFGPRHWLGGGVALASFACGSPLPPESPPTELQEELRPLPVQIESTAHGSVETAGLETDTTASGALAGTTGGQGPAELKQLHRGTLKTPESVLYDANRQLYWVSNISGAPTERDNNGYLSQLLPNGEMKNSTFIAGGKNGVTLNAPKGMALRDGVLFVADIDWVRRFDAETGEPRGGVHLPNATFLNDLTVAEDGSLYVSDSGMHMKGGSLAPSGTDAIYRISGDRATVFVNGTHLNRPNGLLAQGDQLLSVTFGSNELMQFSAKGELQAKVELPAGRLDGIVRLSDGRLAVSSWDAKTVFAGTVAAGFSPLVAEVEAPADLGFDAQQSILLIPSFTQDTLWSVAVGTGSGAQPSAAKIEDAREPYPAIKAQP